MTKKLFPAIALLVGSVVLANAALVGSLHIDVTQDATNVFSLSGFTTRVIDSNTNIQANTKGLVAGNFSFLAGATEFSYTNGTSYDGPDILTYSTATLLRDIDRFGGVTSAGKGLVVWDFDLSGIVSNAWELNVDFSDRDTVNADAWYISLNGLGRALDTTDVTTLTQGEGQGILANITKYIKIGELPAGSDDAAVYSWDLTEIIQAAQANDGLVRLVYAADGFLDDLRLLNDSGLIGAPSTSATPVEFPTVTVMFEDDFSTGSATSFGGSIANGWVAKGAEEKTYNTNDFDGTDFTGTLGWIATNDILNGTSFFDSVAVAFPEYTLTETNEFVSVSFDYSTISTLPAAAGVRVRLYQFGGDLFSNDALGYGVNIPSGTNTAALGYKSIVNAGAFNTGTTNGNAIDSGTAYGDGGSVVFTVTKTGAEEITLSGSLGGKVFLTQVANTNFFTFNAFGLSVGSLEQGMEIDNVRVTSSMPPPIVLFCDDFQTGTASATNAPLVNGWSSAPDWGAAQGWEPKEYNVGGSGILEIRDLDSTETTWDTVFARFQGVPLANDGDWVALTLDMGVYQDLSGAVISGDPLVRITWADSSRTNTAAYGFRVKPSNFHQIIWSDSPNSFPLDFSAGNTSREVLATDGTLQTWTLKIERSGANWILSPTFNGQLFGPVGAYVQSFTNSVVPLDAIFDQVTVSLAGNNVAIKLDNVCVTSNVSVPGDTEPVITHTAVSAGTVTIDFAAGAADTTADFVLQSASTVDGVFADDGLSGAVTGGGGTFQVTTSVNGPVQFYRIRRN